MVKQGVRGRKTPRLLERTFAVLDLFTHQRPEWTTTEAANECRLPIPTVHRILTALEEYGYVTRNVETRRFRLGTAALTLGRSAHAATDLRSVSLPVLQELSRSTGETALLTVVSESRDASVCVDRVESSRPLRLSVEPGRRMPLHAGASQKALLAYMPQPDVERILESPLEKLCESTITHPQKLRRELEKIRACGFATSFQETDHGIWGLAMSLLNDNGVVCAIGLAGPARLPGTDARDYIDVLASKVESVAQKLVLSSSYSRAEKRTT